MIPSRKSRPGVPVTAGRRGFTLVELLVAAGIISVLVAVAAPAVVRVRQLARLSDCQASLRCLVSALPVYAGDNGGWFAPGPIERSYWAGDADRGSPAEPYDNRRIGDPSLSSLDGWYGMGLLWKGGYIDAGRAYYCPSAGDNGGIGYEQGWPRAFDVRRNPGDGKSRIFSTYAYRGGLSSRSGHADGPLNIYRNSAALAVFADDPCQGQMWHEGAYNIAFLDCRVGSFAFDQPVISDGHLQTLWKAIDAWEE